MTVAEKISELAKHVVEAKGFELVEAQCSSFGSQGKIKLFIEKPGGISIQDCTDVSRELGPLLDAENLMENPYHLEVSSPGLGRPLETPKDFSRNLGRKLSVRHTDENGVEIKVVGKLIEVAGNKILLDANNKIHTLDLDSIRKAVVEVQF